MIQPRPYQTEACNAILTKWKNDGINKQVVSLPTGCHAKGQGILMADSSIKKVEDIIVGDQIMGDDGTPRTVLMLRRGHEEMYRIIPAKSTSIPSFVVNKGHKLPLIQTRGGVQSGSQIILTVEEYLKKGRKEKQHLYLRYVNKLHFEAKNKPVYNTFYNILIPFTVKYENEDDYYGFTVDGNQCYLTDNGIVQHNSGKTIIFGMIAKALHTKTLIIAHREELLQQAVQKIKLVYPEANTGILQASERSGLNSDICVASIQTAVKHIPELMKKGFKLAICDEAHHIVANTYKKVFGELGFLGDNDPNKLLLGVTATAFRADSKHLGDIFQEVTYERSILTMIKAGYLCDVRGLSVETSVDISSVHTRTGDFAVDELASLIDTPKRNALVADTYIERGENRHGIVFAVKVEHAMHLATEFKNRGIACEAVYGSMPDDERRDVLQRYSKGEIQILTNVAVLTEGWDAPSTDIIMLARPTQSQGLAIQMIGRGLRITPNKKDCLVIDFVDTTKKHNLCGVSVLHPEEKKTQQGRLFDNDREKEESEETAYTDFEAQLIANIEEIDIFDRSQFAWQSLGGNYKLWLADNSYVCCYMGKNEDSYTPLVVLSNGKCQNLADTEMPLGYALGVCEDYVRQAKTNFSNVSRKDASWRNYPATEKQILALKNLGIPFKAQGLTRGEASKLIETTLNVPITSSQLWFISKHKLHDKPDLLTKAEASRVISDAKAQEKAKPRKKQRF